ncbi:transducin beta-like protein 3 [Chrysochromulina tobinii]|uniref:Transducin beta-like protein 3 n=1 Tax=Chrysochromulina tobinii TaxID=1460289 RepID=A0A0M0LRI6_9EUKA|nr:transducin beta-like protein 3 [Chrysochromulina tobinii]|eukprot:KOO53659.1 transducin beta-like protein 3 [Chrysochromulina sp. CCMP291]
MASQPTLLAKFQEVARHTRIYTGGKVVTHVSAVDGAHGFFVCACGPELNVVDITTGRLLLVVPCDEDDFTAFALAPSGTELVTAGRSRQLRSWVLDVGVTTCEFTRVWKAHKMPVMDLAYDASGRFVASGSADSTAMVFDVAKGIATHVFRGHTGVVHLVRFHPDASRLHLYTSGADNGVRVWDLRSRACVAELKSHVGLPTAIAFSADGATILTAGRDQLVNVWNAATYSLTTSIAVKLFDTHDMGCRLLFGHTDVVLALDSTAAGRKSAAAAGAAGPAGPAGPTSGAELEVVRARAMSTVLGHTKEVNAVAMAPNDRLAVSASQDRTLKVWSLEGGALKEVGVLKGHKRAVWCVSFSPVDKAVASGGGDASVKIWSVSDFSCLRTLEGHSSSVLRILWLSSGLQLLSSGSDGLIKLWSAKNSECACTLDAHEDKVWALDALETAAGGVELWSGSADSLLVRWKDCTFEAQQETVAARELQLQQESQLQIAMHAQQFDEALKLALRLGHPRALRTVLERLLPLPLVCT